MRRFQHESTRMRGYELIYPSSDKGLNEMYEKLLHKSNEIFEDFNLGKKVRMQEKPIDK